jgi:hypothetical protein
MFVEDVHKPACRVVEDAMLNIIEGEDHQLPSVQNLANNVMLHIIEGEDHQLPNVQNLQRLVNRVREDLKPAEPKDLGFVASINKCLLRLS